MPPSSVAQSSSASSATGRMARVSARSPVSAARSFRGTDAKSDPIDVGVIGDFARSSDNLRLYEPPRPEQIELRDLVARRTELHQAKEAGHARVEHVGSPQVIGRQRRPDDNPAARHGSPESMSPTGTVESE